MQSQKERLELHNAPVHDLYTNYSIAQGYSPRLVYSSKPSTESSPAPQRTVEHVGHEDGVSSVWNAYPNSKISAVSTTVLLELVPLFTLPTLLYLGVITFFYLYIYLYLRCVQKEKRLRLFLFFTQNRLRFTVFSVIVATVSVCIGFLAQGISPLFFATYCVALAFGLPFLEMYSFVRLSKTRTCNCPVRCVLINLSFSYTYTWYIASAFVLGSIYGTQNSMVQVSNPYDTKYIFAFSCWRWVAHFTSTADTLSLLLMYTGFNTLYPTVLTTTQICINTDSPVFVRAILLRSLVYIIQVIWYLLIYFQSQVPSGTLYLIFLAVSTAVCLFCHFSSSGLHYAVSQLTCEM
uniref:Ribosomal RNA large subunit methyltransferase E n=1 Tax=Lygus hesperus TaxID=30085 RepID=A0A0A9XJL9_LYGHE